MKTIRKTQELESLFQEWKNRQAHEPDEDFNYTKGDTIYITKNYFCEDGIINESVFEQAKIKVLFITNESNDDSIQKEDSKLDRRIDFNEYYESHKDGWDGKLRERVCALYKVITENDTPFTDYYNNRAYEVARNFAFMNINKRGGLRTIKDRNGTFGKANHIEEYCKIYHSYIKKEIEIIDPDIIVWLGAETYDMGIHVKYLDAYRKNDKIYMRINHKEIPILRMWHTSYYRAKIKPMDQFQNKTTGKLAAKLYDELRKYSLK